MGILGKMREKMGRWGDGITRPMSTLLTVYALYKYSLQSISSLDCLLP